MIKKGDQVICVDVRGLDIIRSEPRRGGVYTVRSVYGEFIDIGVVSGSYPGFFAWRFRKHQDRLASLRKSAAAVDARKALVAA